MRRGTPGQGAIYHFGAAPVFVFGQFTHGDSLWVGAWCVIDASGGLSIGNNVSISAQCAIYTHQSGAGRGAPVARMPVKIGNDVYLGPQSIVSMGVKIGDGAVIGAHSFVRENVPEGEVWAGTPARRIKDVGE